MEPNKDYELCEKDNELLQTLITGFCVFYVATDDEVEAMVKAGANAELLAKRVHKMAEQYARKTMALCGERFIEMLEEIKKEEKQSNG